MRNKIRHDGVVTEVESGCVHVRILQASACAVCAASNHCTASESKEKTIDVYTSSAEDYRVGDRVMVSASTSVASLALWLAFGVPFLLLMAVLVGVLVYTANEGLAALGALGALIPYYIVLFFNKHWMRRKMSFEIEENNN